ncbi:MAG: hypothetical protein E5V28_19880 [Mesorhizobium sp.]|uniref:hypothetical protein n=1 Tax=Mesorhizobium sp. TaxID=1871066 RepID=UPI0011F4812F|nr:hypothetical protein [Mesorhizobium sp.]TIR27963.1 MAG: hypothetical protein E5X35_32765 [Mesorhizobium sp.]TIS18669.1 MAG: hypothetical protein E5X07_31310 [Mesorhizobium sp.]TIW43114.1 MAG: hypothetical protein E5V71_08910 [Mesorhizobium sp.]TIX56368.1 MAG: hypothetical protein E5V28_19880 [Mesorhizobium sp.]TIX83524.1 MAG: hypothetical protein E5V27_09640 [Mesorhizobium sp.]
MLSRFSQFLGPEDLALCQRVFDQICADASLGSKSIEAEDLAAAVLTAFHCSPNRTEADLLAAIRSGRNDFEKQTG